MSGGSQIRINALLLQREELFVRIHDIEQAVAGILGEPYPFTRPALPSDQRVKRKPAGRAAAGAKDKLRKLEPGEAAYRVTYRQLGQTRMETHESPEALRTLLAAQSAQLQVRTIETIDDAGAVKAILLGEPPR